MDRGSLRWKKQLKLLMGVLNKGMDWLTNERKEKLKMIMAEDYGLELSDSQVKEFGENLVQMFNLLYDQKFEQRPLRFIDEPTKGSYD